MSHPFDAVMAKVKADIERVGWSAIGVFPTKDEPGPVAYTYTIGLLETERHPELIVYGLGSQQAHGLLLSAIDEIRAGVKFVAGGRYPRVVRDYDVGFRETRPDGRPLNVARAHYDSDVEALQLVWPDEAGLIPGLDEGVDPMTELYQTPLLEEES